MLVFRRGLIAFAGVLLVAHSRSQQIEMLISTPGFLDDLDKDSVSLATLKQKGRREVGETNARRGHDS